MGLDLSTLDKPITEKVSTDEANDKLKCATSSMQGWRTEQEDAHNCILDFDVNTSLFAVYDGHGGHEVAEYCSLHLPEFLKTTEAYKEGNYEKALIDTYLGFDATIVTPTVLKQLKVMSRARGGFDSDESSDVEENLSNLCEEATMPLEEVIEKYTANLKKLEKLPKKEKPVSEAGSSGEPSGKSETSKPETPKVEDKPEEAPEVSSSESAEPKERNDKQEAQAEGDEKKENGVVPASEEKTPQENGDVAKKGKGKALTKTKGVPPPTVISARPKRSIQQLYNKILESESESDSEDEEDKTFQGPEQLSSSDEDNSKLEEEEESETSDEDDELDDENEEEEEDEDGDIQRAEEEDHPNASDPGYQSGCTAVVALLRESQLFVANAGDSRCVVCRDGKAVEMSFDHKPEDTIECKRIKHAGGFIQGGRVDGGLNLSRAIGDHSYKLNKKLTDREQKITALPDVRSLTINIAEDEFMVLACDGIWNSMSNQEVVDFVKARLETQPEKLSQVCEELFEHCLAPKATMDGTGCDNMTAVIVLFKRNLCKRSSDNDEVQESKRLKPEEPSEVSA